MDEVVHEAKTLKPHKSRTACGCSKGFETEKNEPVISRTAYVILLFPILELGFQAKDTNLKHLFATMNLTTSQVLGERNKRKQNPWMRSLGLTFVGCTGRVTWKPEISTEELPPSVGL